MDNEIKITPGQAAYDVYSGLVLVETSTAWIHLNEWEKDIWDQVADAVLKNAQVNDKSK